MTTTTTTTTTLWRRSLPSTSTCVCAARDGVFRCRRACVLVGGDDGALRVLDAQRGEIVQSVAVSSAPLLACAVGSVTKLLDADERTSFARECVVGDADGGVLLLHDGEVVYRFEIDCAVTRIALETTADGLTEIVVGDQQGRLHYAHPLLVDRRRTIRLQDLERGPTLNQRASAVRSLCSLPDARGVLVVDASRTVRTLYNGKLVDAATLDDASSLAAAAWSSTHQCALLGGCDGSVYTLSSSSSSSSIGKHTRIDRCASVGTLIGGIAAHTPAATPHGAVVVVYGSSNIVHVFDADWRVCARLNDDDDNNNNNNNDNNNDNSARECVVDVAVLDVKLDADNNTDDSAPSSPPSRLLIVVATADGRCASVCLTNTDDNEKATTATNTNDDDQMKL